MSFDPSTARPEESRFDPSSAFAETPGGAVTGIAQPKQTVSDFLSRRDPDVNYRTGVPDWKVRAGFSFMSSEEEKTNFLNKQVGEGNWNKDSFGAYVIKPEGLSKLGIKSDKSVALDEQLATRYDIADIAGDVPTIVGGVGAGMAATGLGAVPGMALTALGAAGGKAYAELGKQLAGYGKQTAGETAETIAKEGGAAALGEGAVRALAPITRFVLGPGAGRMTPEKAQLAKAAQEQGFHVRPGAVTDAPILARWEGMVKAIFGDLYETQNRAAAQAGVSRLGGGAAFGKEQAGELLVKNIRAARIKFAEEMGERYAQTNASVSTEPLKATVNSILGDIPGTKTGELAFVSGETRKFFDDILNLPDSLPARQMQRVRTMLREASISDNLVPGVAKHDARELRKATDLALDGVEGLKSLNAEYREGIRRFDNTVVSAITRDPGKAGAVDVDQIVDYVIRPEHTFRVKRIKDIVSSETWDKVKSAHAEDLLSNVVRTTDDPLKTVFDGKSMRDALDSYGRNTLTEVHGKQWVDDAYAFANSMMLANKTTKLSGGIVAANVALHPIQNLPRLIWIRVLAKLIEQPGTFRYLTDGVRLGPATKEGAAALSRLTAQAAAIARDETGSARFTLTEQENQ